MTIIENPLSLVPQLFLFLETLKSSTISDRLKYCMWFSQSEVELLLNLQTLGEKYNYIFKSG